MRVLVAWCSVVALSMVAGCSDPGTAGPVDGGPGVDSRVPGLDGGGDPIDGAMPRPDAGDRVDGAMPPDGGTPTFDAGPPEPCPTPGVSEPVPCGACGTVDRFCTASRVWAYGVCRDEGACMPGTIDSMACGNCGTQPARCTIACTWETTGACSGEGECMPGARTRSGAGCMAGATREVLCSDACAFEPAGACEVDGCPTPGALESVPCGTMCGMQERFCNAMRVWEYGACLGEGICMPGTTGSQACGMCGTQTTRCTTACTWMASGMCMAEGECAPGATRRTPMGCPAGQTQAQRCSATCGWTTTEMCRPDMPIDVMILLDVTGSHGMRVRDQRALLQSRLVTPLLGIMNVAVGVSYYADFPIDPYGSTGDRPFEGGVEPSLTISPIATELGTIPTMGGNDGPESGIEALSVLTGGTRPASATALTCSAGRTAGGCWRAGARRVIVVWTDAANHNGPDPASSGLYSPYTTITPAPASWTMASTLGAMRSQNVELLVLYHTGAFSSGDVRAQADEMISDLSQPAANAINATFDTTSGTGPLGTAFDAVVARVRTLSGT